MIGSSQSSLPDNTQHSQQTDIHARGGIRTHNLSRRATTNRAAHWDRLLRTLLHVFGYNRDQLRTILRHLRLEGLKAMNIYGLVCWVETPRSIVCEHQCFTRTPCHPLHATSYFKSQFQKSGSRCSLCSVRQMNPPPPCQHESQTDIFYPI